MRQPLESQQRNTRQKKRGERFLNHPNPLAETRKAYGYSQTEVAKHLGVTRQIIVDTEVGLSMHPNPKYVAYLAQYDPTLRTALSEAWYAWRADRRRDLSDPDGPRCLVEALQTSTQLPSTFSALVTSASARTGVSIDSHYETGGVRTFARMLILQTSIIKSYIDRGHHWEQIALALKDVGLSPTLIALIHNLPRTETQRRLNENHVNALGAQND